MVEPLRGKALQTN